MAQNLNVIELIKSIYFKTQFELRFDRGSLIPLPFPCTRPCKSFNWQPMIPQLFATGKIQSKLIFLMFFFFLFIISVVRISCSGNWYMDKGWCRTVWYIPRLCWIFNISLYIDSRWCICCVCWLRWLLRSHQREPMPAGNGKLLHF